MEDAIKQSLNQFSQQSTQPHKIYSTRYNKSNSFSQLSDWNNKHKYLHQNFSLPRIAEEPEVQRVIRVAQSQISDSITTNSRKNASPTHLAPINIKFSVPDCLRGFEKSFYDTYLKQKRDRKSPNIKPEEFFSLQQQNRNRSLQKSINKIKSQYQSTRAAIINRVMNRKTRLKRQHFLQQFLTTNTAKLNFSQRVTVQKSKEKLIERQKEKERKNERQREKIKILQRQKDQI